MPEIMKINKIACFLSLVYMYLELTLPISSQNNIIRCRLCNRATTLSDCNKIVTCDRTLMNCYMDEVITDQLTVVYQGGCRPKDVCSQGVGKRGTELHACSRCCNLEEECNKRLCGIKDDTSNISYCYSCDHRNPEQSSIKDPRDCVTLEICQPDKVCFTTESDFGGKDSFYLGCLSKHQCKYLMQSAFDDYKMCVANITQHPPGTTYDQACGDVRKRSTSFCHSCCADNACNYGTCREQNERIFQLAVQGKFDMNTLKAV